MAKGVVLCTGGAGYIGGTSVISLIEAGYEVICFDDYSNSSPKAVDQLRKLTNTQFKAVEGDVTDKVALDKLFQENKIDIVIHYAGKKAVGESVSKPLLYYRTNFLGSMNLIETMYKHGVKKFVFSSSATVYLPCETLITEDAPLACSNPYGWSKLYVEQLVRDFCHAHSDFKAVLLRYFNPIGAHESGDFGESPSGIPNNLLPYLLRVADKQYPHLNVFGNDYNTADGTGVRDYIHVVDLAAGHVKAVDKLVANNVDSVDTYNLGAGKGFSVMEMLKELEKVSGNEVPFKIAPRRPGDLATVVCSPAKAEKELNWKVHKDLHDGIASSWKWQKLHPQGFE